MVCTNKIVIGVVETALSFREQYASAYQSLPAQVNQYSHVMAGCNCSCYVNISPFLWMSFLEHACLRAKKTWRYLKLSSFVKLARKDDIAVVTRAQQQLFLECVLLLLQ